MAGNAPLPLGMVNVAGQRPLAARADGQLLRVERGGQRIGGRLVRGGRGERDFGQIFRALPHDFNPLRLHLKQQRHARLVRPQVERERARGDDLVTARRNCRAIFERVSLRGRGFDGERVFDALRRQEGREILPPATRLVVLAEQKHELMPDEILQHDRRLRLHFAFGLTRRA